MFLYLAVEFISKNRLINHPEKENQTYPEKIKSIL